MCLGIPGKIVRIWEDQGTRMADVDFGGAVKDVCLAYLPQAQIGDYTIVHAGFGLTRLDEKSALETLAMFQELGMLEDELGIPSKPGEVPA
jgi:hydrogenase expression/formation protein HypC